MHFVRKYLFRWWWWWLFLLLLLVLLFIIIIIIYYYFYYYYFCYYYYFQVCYPVCLSTRRRHSQIRSIGHDPSWLKHPVFVPHYWAVYNITVRFSHTRSGQFWLGSVYSTTHSWLSVRYFSFQPVFHDWCNKDRGMSYSVCGMVHIKES